MLASGVATSRAMAANLSSVLFIEQSPEQWVEWIPQRGAGFDGLEPVEFSTTRVLVQLRFGRVRAPRPEVMAPRRRYHRSLTPPH
jgi:hypothetical protein